MEHNLVRAAKKIKQNNLFTSTFSIFEKNYDNLIDEIEPLHVATLWPIKS